MFFLLLWENIYFVYFVYFGVFRQVVCFWPLCEILSSLEKKFCGLPWSWNWKGTKVSCSYTILFTFSMIFYRRLIAASWSHLMTSAQSKQSRIWVDPDTDRDKREKQQLHLMHFLCVDEIRLKNNACQLQDI